MRTTSKGRDVIHPFTGAVVPAPFPVTREEAIAEDISQFYPFTKCPIHGQYHSTYVSTGIRSCCANRDATEAYDKALRTGEPVSVGVAHMRKLDYYWRWKPHGTCGHSGKTTLNGKCWYCAQAVQGSPRQAAIDKGEIWYTPLPGDECKNGHLAPRRVNNGSCKQCEEDARKRAEVIPMHKNPDLAELVMDRETARKLGFTVYRTGVACGRGHTGFRYVSTGGCIECLGR